MNQKAKRGTLMGFCALIGVVIGFLISGLWGAVVFSTVCTGMVYVLIDLPGFIVGVKKARKALSEELKEVWLLRAEYAKSMGLWLLVWCNRVMICYLVVFYALILFASLQDINFLGHVSLAGVILVKISLYAVHATAIGLSFLVVVYAFKEIPTTLQLLKRGHVWKNVKTIKNKKNEYASVLKEEVVFLFWVSPIGLVIATGMFLCMLLWKCKLFLLDEIVYFPQTVRQAHSAIRQGFSSTRRFFVGVYNHVHNDKRVAAVVDGNIAGLPTFLLVLVYFPSMHAMIAGLVVGIVVGTVGHMIAKNKGEISHS
ncbi:MAG: hypothetical protein KC736_02485 [Candidatus Moranbacteria bacterium]|nr:hypothetical protein [Candidatus Moranbacteria bacterium]